MPMYETEYEIEVGTLYESIVSMEDANEIEIDFNQVPPSLRASAKSELHDWFSCNPIPDNCLVKQGNTMHVYLHFCPDVGALESKLVDLFVPIAQRVLDGDYPKPTMREWIYA